MCLSGKTQVRVNRYGDDKKEKQLQLSALRLSASDLSDIYSSALKQLFMNQNSA